MTIDVSDKAIKIAAYCYKASACRGNVSEILSKI